MLEMKKAALRESRAITAGKKAGKAKEKEAEGDE